MFSGFTDLNSTFASFSSALSLDNLQPDGQPTQNSTAAGAPGPPVAATPNSETKEQIDQPVKQVEQKTPLKPKIDRDVELRYQRRIETLENQLQLREREIQSLLEKSASTRNENSTSFHEAGDSDRMKRENEELLQQNEQLLNQWSHSQQLILEKEQDIKKLQISLVEQETKYKAFENFHYDEMQNQEKKTREYIVHTEEIQKLAKKELKEKDKELAKTVKEHDEIKKQLQFTIESLQAQLNNGETHSKPTNDASEAINLNENEVEQLQTKISEKDAKIAKLVEKSKELMHRHSEMNGKVQELENQQLVLQQELQDKEAIYRQTVSDLQEKLGQHARQDTLAVPHSPSTEIMDHDSNAGTPSSPDVATPNKRNFKRLQKQNEELLQQVQTKQQQLDELQKRLITQSSSSVNILSKENDASDTNQDLSDKLAALAIEVTSSHSQYGELKAQYDALQQQEQKAQTQLKHAINQQKNFQTAYEQLLEAKEAIDEEVVALADEKKELADNMKKKNNEISTLQAVINTKDSELESLRKQLATDSAHFEESLLQGNDKIAEKEGVIVSLKEQLASLTENNEASAQLTQTLQEKEEQLRSMETELKSWQRKYDQVVEGSTQVQSQIEILENSLQEKEKFITTLEVQFVQLNAEHEEQLKKLKNDLIAQLEKQQTEAKQHSLESLSSKDEELQRLITEKVKLQTELQETIATNEKRMTGLTDKLKELMQRYAETKTKLSQTEKQLQQQQQDHDKLLQQKESEVVKHKLKYDRNEQMLEESQHRNGELSEKYGELQRTLLDYKQQITRLTHDQQELQQLQIQHSLLMKEKLELEEVTNHQIHELTAKVAFLEANTAEQERDLLHTQERKLIASQEEQQKLLEQLYYYEKENALLQEQKQTGNEYEILLDNYKKKATVALKKANDNVAEIAAAKDSLEMQFHQLQKNHDELQYTFQSLSARYEETQAQVKTLLEKEEQFKQQQGDYDQIITYLNTQMSSLQDQINVYQVQSHSSTMNDSRGMIPRVPSKNNGLNNNNHKNNNRGMAMNKSGSEVVSFDENDAYTPRNSGKYQPYPRVGSKDASLDEISQLAQDQAQAQEEQENEEAQMRIVRNGNAIVFPTQDTLIFVKELQIQLQELQQEVVNKHMESDRHHQLYLVEKDEKCQLQIKYDELTAYLARLRKLQVVTDTNTSSSSSNTPSTGASGNSNSSSSNSNILINYEYLKNCIYKYMISTELSEKQRLYRVIGMLLNFTNGEIKLIEERLQQETLYANPTDQIQQAISSSVGGFSWDMLFGATNNNHPPNHAAHK